MTFRINQKVVCVDDSSTNDRGVKEIRNGEIYTLSWVGSFQGVLSVRLSEVLRDDMNWSNRGHPFGIFRFRPIVERKTNIEIFERLLTPVHSDPELVGDRR